MFLHRLASVPMVVVTEKIKKDLILKDGFIRKMCAIMVVPLRAQTHLNV